MSQIFTVLLIYAKIRVHYIERILARHLNTISNPKLTLIKNKVMGILYSQYLGGVAYSCIHAV
jgi:hypothetical protein